MSQQTLGQGEFVVRVPRKQAIRLQDQRCQGEDGRRYQKEPEKSGEHTPSGGLGASSKIGQLQYEAQCRGDHRMLLAEEAGDCQ